MSRAHRGAVTAFVIVVTAVVATAAVVISILNAAPAGAAPRDRSPLASFVRTCEHVAQFAGGGGADLAWCSVVPERDAAKLERACVQHGGQYVVRPGEPDGEADVFPTYYCFAP